MDTSQWLPMTDSLEKTSTIFTSIQKSVEEDLKKADYIEPHIIEDKMRQLNDLIHGMEKNYGGSQDSQRRIEALRSSMSDLESRVVKVTGPLVYPIESVREPSYSERLQKTFADIEQQGKGWKTARERIAETETIGEEILHNLSRQRETVLLASSISDDSNTLLGKGQRIIRKMSRKISQNRIFWWCSIWLTGFVLLTTLYLRVFYHHK